MKRIDYLATPRDWWPFYKHFVVIQVYGQTYEGWLNHLWEDRGLIGIDRIQEDLIWQDGAEELDTKYFPMKDTLLCQYEA